MLLCYGATKYDLSLLSALTNFYPGDSLPREWHFFIADMFITRIKTEVPFKRVFFKTKVFFLTCESV
jgi:hypothetical protein